MRWSAHRSDSSRGSWVYQQILKLGAGAYIDGLSSSYLVIDSDVIFSFERSHLLPKGTHGFLTPARLSITSHIVRRIRGCWARFLRSAIR